MLSFARSRFLNAAVKSLLKTEKAALPTLVRNYSSGHVESNEEFDARWESYFKK